MWPIRSMLTNQIHALCRLHSLSWSTITSRVMSASYYLTAMFISQRQLGSCSVTRPFPPLLPSFPPSLLSFLFLSSPVKHIVCSEKLAGVRIQLATRSTCKELMWHFPACWRRHSLTISQAVIQTIIQNTSTYRCLKQVDHVRILLCIVFLLIRELEKGGEREKE